MKTAYIVCEFDDGVTDEWLFETREEAETFMQKKRNDIDPEIYWIHYYIEEHHLTKDQMDKLFIRFGK